MRTKFDAPGFSDNNEPNVEAIMRKPASALTPEEREFLRREILAVLAENQ
jgi:hypothetical protein